LLSMITCIQVSYSQCDMNCEIQCIGQINVSLDQSCSTEITPAMGGNNIEPACNSLYSIKLYDEHGDLIPGTTVGLEQNGQLITYEITENECGNKCWGKAQIEYKFPPQIDCPSDLTVACGVVDLLDFPSATGGCAAFEVILLSQIKDPISCDPNFSSSIVRTYQARDEFGNTSLCSHTIFVERIDINDIIFPTNSKISCSDSLLIFDEYGFPIPWVYHPFTGSGSEIGVPIICDVDVVDGLFCNVNNDYSGVPLIPSGGATLIEKSDNPYSGPDYISSLIDDDNSTALCNAVLTYTDIEIPNVPCKRKIIRTWDVREWWCTQEFTNGNIQLIEIIDDQAPVFNCPNDFSVSTDYDCGGRVLLDPVDAYDECNSELSYSIRSGTNVINTNGGYIDLNLGTNFLTYTVKDACNNQSSCDVKITVMDDTEPVAVCEQFKVVSISQSGQTLVFAEPFDNGSWDECGIDRFEVRRMDTLCVASDTLFSDRVNFCCSDVGRETMVVFRAFDWSGNFNDCMVTVEVQDKIAPTITCPDDQSIDCDQGYDIDNLALAFGEATVVDNCSQTQNINEIVTADVSQCGVGNITRRFEILAQDSSVLVSCKQFITITNTTTFNPNNIIWPLDYQVSDVCRTNDLDPQDLPDLFNYPVFPNQESCTLLGYNHEDRIFSTSGGCIKIERYWTVINWCGTSEVGFDQFTSPNPQIIDIMNMVAPVIAPADSLFFESINISCLGDSVEIERTAVDDCDFLSWSYEIRDIDETVVFEGDTNYINMILPIGEYHILWRVEDGCGNFDLDEQFVSMLNVKAPTPVCLNGLSVSLIGMDLDSNGVIDAEMVELWANDFDSGSSHSCGNEIALSFSSDTTDRNRFFDCNDIGITEVQLWATDILTGAQDFCRANIEILDNNMFSICDGNMNTVTVSGDVFDENNRIIAGVEVSLANTSNVIMTDDEGQYAFVNMPLGGTYEVVPMKNTDPLNGISTLDLILIQRHILGFETISSPYKLIAADINKNNAISSIDLIELRKLILGVNDEIPSNLSWRFIEADFEFVEPTNPWVTSLPESYLIESLDSPEDIDFIGVKIGDVNNSVVTSFYDETIDSRNKNIEIELDYTVNDVTGNVNVDIYMNEELSMDGMQGTFELDRFMNKENIDFTSGQIEVFDYNFNLENLDQGWFTFSFVEEKAKEVDISKPLFSIELKNENIGNLVDILHVSSQKIKSEFYSNKNSLELTSRMRVSKLDLDLKLMAMPNPWSAQTTLSVELPKEEMIVWNFYDVTGRKIYSEEMRGKEGNNILSLDNSKINTSGIVYVRLVTTAGIEELKMIVL